MGGACVRSAGAAAASSDNSEKAPAATATPGTCTAKSSRPDVSVAMTCRTLGIAHVSGGDLEKARSLFQEAADILRAANHPEAANTLFLLADTLRARGEYDEAEKALRECISMRSEALGPTHAETGAAMGELADLLLVMGRYQESDELFKSSREISAAQDRPLGVDVVDLSTF
eukprot:tig00020943_g16299.t1